MDSWLVKYAENFIKKHNFDSSHDMQHFINVFNYAKDIISNDYPDGSLIEGFSREDSLDIVYKAAFSHDLIDSKYVKSDMAIEELKSVFLENGYNVDKLSVILFIIDNMSFSKQRKRIEELNSKNELSQDTIAQNPIPQKYILALNIVSDADKLDAYRPERVVAYQETKNTDLKTTKGWIKTILAKRVLKYKDQWLKTNYSKKICLEMHEKVEKYVEDNLKDVEMFEY